jgi:tetratricopeptide (TPR) repeat protein
LLVSALAQRQRYDEAAEVLRQGATGSPGDLLALLERLNQATQQAKPNERPTLVRLEQQTLADLEGKKPQFDAAAQRRFQAARLRTLIDTGQGKTALALAESLAKKYPDDGSVQEDYARLLGRSTDPAQLRLAFARWRDVAERSRPGTPRWFHGQLGLAQTQLALGNRAQARTIVKIVESSYPDFSPTGGEKDPEQRGAFLDVLARTEKP